jgi:membrane-bound lytic murein transglycosylase D
MTGFHALAAALCMMAAVSIAGAADLPLAPTGSPVATPPESPAQVVERALLEAFPAAASAAGPDAARPQRSLRTESVELEHHGSGERFLLSLPYGEPQFERFRAAYLSPGGRKWIEAVRERSLAYSSYIRSRIHFYGVPEELFYLPFIESEYSPKAVSRSGAAGLWQFMRNSVDGYDIRIDEWIDERKDFMKSTDAALRKLRSNHDRFGDWLLAIAAYNCGAGAMDRAVKAGGSRDYWVLRERGALPPETATYIPKFLAVVSVAMHAGRNGLETPWTQSVQWVRISLDRPVDISMLASVAGVPLDTMKIGNPELRYGVTPPEGRYAVKVPVEAEEGVRKALASREQLMNVYMHMVRSGDTVSAISRHYEVPVAMVTRLNPGLNPDKIRIGQTIVVPAFKDKKPYVSEQAQVDELSFSGSHVVVKGDTLWSLSLRYGVQPEVLAARNGMNLSSVLREGMTLHVPILE